jgi:glycosyltransferase involved in cell wall biosynthesis
MANSPLVAVIIPSYNYADHIADCVDSVLAQTFTDFEVIVVDDGSQDNTREVVAQFTDPRVKYIWQENKGLPGARNTGICASSGKYLAFLDSDDKYHPHKLEIQVDFLEKNPAIGLVYNSRYLVDSRDRILRLRRAPETVSLTDLLKGYPFAPSDVVMRRKWAERIGLFDESFVRNSEDLNFHIRLQLAGCRFAGVPKALAYRQIHTGRHFSDIAGKVDTYLRALNTAFNDPRCSPEVLALRDQAYAEHYLVWGYQALVQDEVELGQDLLHQAVILNSTLLTENGRSLRQFLGHASIRDGGNHEPLLRRFFSRLPVKLAILAPYEAPLIKRGYLMRGLRDVVWGREEEALDHFHHLTPTDVQEHLDTDLMDLLTHQIAQYKFEFGEQDTGQLLQRLTKTFEQFNAHAQMRQFNGAYALDQAFSNYNAGAYATVPAQVMRAIAYNPRHLLNRGALSIMVRSLFQA